MDYSIIRAVYQLIYTTIYRLELAYTVIMAYMGRVGIEPTRVFSPEDFKSPASACSATAP